MTTGPKGFTLIELAVVLVILGIVFAIAVPYIGAMIPDRELQRGAREMAAALREARSRAILSNEDVLLRLDVNGRSYAISGDKHVHELPKNIRLKLHTAQQERTGKAVGSIRFFPDGTSTGGHVLLSGDKAAYKVTIDWLTGSVKIQE